MKIVFFAALISLSVFAVNASEEEKQELFRKSEEFMNGYYKDLIEELNKLRESGKTYSANEARTVATIAAVKQVVKRTAESEKLMALYEKLEKAGEVGDFHMHEQGKPELKKELEAAIAGLIKKDDISPRFIGAIIMGSTQLASDVVKMGLTRY